MIQHTYKNLYLPGTLLSLLFAVVFALTFVLFSTAFRPLMGPHETLEAAGMQLRAGLDAYAQAERQGDLKSLSVLEDALRGVQESLNEVMLPRDPQFEDLKARCASLTRYVSELKARQRDDLGEREDVAGQAQALLFALSAREHLMIGERDYWYQRTQKQIKWLFALAMIAALFIWALNTFWVIPRYAIKPLERYGEALSQQAHALRQSEQKLRAIYENAPVMIALVDEAGTIHYANPAFLNFAQGEPMAPGVRLGEAFGCPRAWESAGGCGHGSACGACELRGAIAACLGGETSSVALEYNRTLQRRDGAISSTLLGSAVALDLEESGMVLLCLQDFTSRKQTEVALRRSEERMARVLECANDGWWDWDLDSREFYYSRRWWNMLGYEVNELPADDALWRRLLHPDDADRVNFYLEEMLASSRTHFEVEFRLQHKRGALVPVASKGQVFRDGAGRATRISGINLDLTERNRWLSEYQTLIQLSKDGFWRCDLNGRFLEVNEALCVMVGYSEQELLTMSISDLEATEDRRDVRDHIEEIRATGFDIFESVLRTKTGESVDVDVSVRYLSDLGEQFFAFLRDITERKRYERELKSNESRFRSYVEHAPIGVVVTDLDGNYVETNTAAARDLGYTREELLRLSVRDVVHESVREDALTHFGSVKSNTHVARELVLRKSDGSPFYAELHAARLDERHLLEYHIDLTERKKAESVMLRQAALDSILAEISKSIVVSNYDHSIAELILLRAKELTGSQLGWILAEESDGDLVEYRVGVAPRTIPKSPARSTSSCDGAPACEGAAVRPKAPAFDNSGPLNAERFSEGDKTSIRCMLLVPVIGENGWLGQIVLANTPGGYADTDLADVGKIAELYRLYRHGKQIKEALDHSHQQFLHAQKMEAVGRLAGGVAHDFNNILGIIMGYTDYILSSEKAAENYREHLFSVRKATERGADLTRQLLAFARKQTIQPRTLDLNESVDAMLKLLQRLAGEQITMRWNPAEDQILVTIDPSQLDQLLANLILNARDAIADNGEIRITTASRMIQRTDSDAQNGNGAARLYAVLEVSDSGSGMDDDTLTRIFEPFFTTKAEGKGTGLGLATVHGIVHQNGGFIEPASEKGVGTTFAIFLPAAQHVRTNKVAPESARHAWPVGNETVLLVDDQCEFRDACQRILECLGYNVISAASGPDAITAFDGVEGNVDLLMTDLVMPEMNGKALWKNLHEKRPALRCLFMSGYAADILNEQDLLDNNVQFVLKPFSTSTIAEKIREALDSRAGVVDLPLP